MDLTEEERIGLLWMTRCNPRMGFLCQAVRRYGAIPEFSRLVREDYARLVSPRHGDKGGYWILPKGRQALAEPPTPPPASSVS